MDGDGESVDQRCDGVSGDVDHVDLSDVVIRLHKFMWRPRRLHVGDYTDELDSESDGGDRLRITRPLTNCVLLVSRKLLYAQLLVMSFVPPTLNRGSKVVRHLHECFR